MKSIRRLLAILLAASCTLGLFSGLTSKAYFAKPVQDGDEMPIF